MSRDGLAEEIIIDWYDGIVSSVASLHQQQVFVSLVAWDQRAGQRAYAVVPIDRAISDRMRSVLGGDRGMSKQAQWRAIQDQIGQIRRACTGPALLVRCRQFWERPSAEKEVEIDEDLRSRLGRGVEVALEEESVAKWFRLIERDT